MRKNSRLGSVIALAVFAPAFALAFPSSAQSQASENTVALSICPIAQIMSINVDAGAIVVLTPKVIEQKTASGTRILVDVASSKGEIVTLSLAKCATLIQVDNDEAGSVSAPISLDSLSAALNEKQHISVGVEKNTNGEVEVHRLTLFADEPQKSIVQLLKEHFEIRSLASSKSNVAK